jgi:antitoxin CcdA
MGKTELKIQIDTDLAQRAAAEGVDVDAIAEAALRKALPLDSGDERARRWAEENAEAIAAHRKRIEEFGVFGDDLRTW